MKKLLLAITIILTSGIAMAATEQDMLNQQLKANLNILASQSKNLTDTLAAVKVQFTNNQTVYNSVNGINWSDLSPLNTGNVNWSSVK